MYSFHRTILVDERELYARLVLFVKFGCTVVNDKKSTKRKYRLKQRADDMAATRRRIIEAAVALHGTVGPARTTISAIAQRAGVQRHTVYRHFPTDADLFGACSTHYFTENSPPDQEPWRATKDPQQRLRRALDELYAYYERNEPMFTKVLRDLELVEALPPTMSSFQLYLAETIETLAVGWGTRGRRRRLLTAGLRHALDFHVWRSLAIDNELTRTEAVQLSTGLVEAAAAPRRRAAA